MNIKTLTKLLDHFGTRLKFSRLPFSSLDMQSRPWIAYLHWVGKHWFLHEGVSGYLVIVALERKINYITQSFF